MTWGGMLTPPLPGDLVARVAVAPGVVVDGFFCVDEDVLFALAAAVEACDCVEDALADGGDWEGGGGVGLVVYAGRGVLGGVGVAG